MRALFDALVDALDAATRGDEVLAAVFDGEASDFIRLNHGRLRQAGRVERAVARLRLVDGERQAFATVTLPGLSAAGDTVHTLVADAAERLRAALAESAPDPLLDLSREPSRIDDEGPDPPFDRAGRTFDSCRRRQDPCGFPGGWPDSRRTVRNPYGKQTTAFRRISTGRD